MRTRLQRLDRWGNKLGEVHDPLSAIHEQGVDGTDGLALTCFDDVGKGDHIRWRDEDTDQYFEHEVISARRVHAGPGRPVTEATCVNQVCELFDDDLTARTRAGYTVQQVMVDLLRYTRWTYSDSGDFSGTRTWEFDDTSVREAVSQVVETLGCEMVASSSRTITLRSEIVSASVTGRFTYGRNMGTVTREVASDEVYTAVRAIGKDGITETVYNETALDTWGRPPRYSGGAKRHSYCRLVDSGCETISELRTLATQRLAEVSAPKVTYTCDIGDIGDRRLGDLLQVIDRGFTPELRMQARITRITKDLLGHSRGGQVVIGSKPPRYMEVAFKSIAGRTFRHYNY